MRRSTALAAVYALALSQPMFRREFEREPADYQPTIHASHDAERIAKAEAKRARKAARRAKQLEAKP